MTSQALEPFRGTSVRPQPYRRSPGTTGADPGILARRLRPEMTRLTWWLAAAVVGLVFWVVVALLIIEAAR